MLDTEAAPVERRLADRVRALRASRGLSLEALAALSGVSRSMISLVERAESSPTAAVLDKLAGALGVTLASLFDAPGAKNSPGPVSRRAEQAEWRDPASGYRRRNVTPPGASQPMQIVEVHVPAGARVAFDTPVRQARVWQQVWMLAGTVDVTVGTDRHRLREGDCLAMQLDRPTVFHNPTRKAARYAVVVADESQGRR